MTLALAVHVMMHHEALDRQALRSTLSTGCLLLLLAAPTLAFQHYHPVLLRSHLPMSSHHSASKPTSHQFPLHPVSLWRRDGYTRQGGVSMGLLSPMLSKVAVRLISIVSFWSHVDALHAVIHVVGIFRASLIASLFWQAGGAVLVAGGPRGTSYRYHHCRGRRDLERQSSLVIPLS